MMFEHIIGNNQIKEYLVRSVQKGTTGNSLLFAGPDGIGKSLFAEAFVKLLLCQNDPQGIQQKKIDSGNHPDVHIYRPEGKIGMHSIAAMRQFCEEVYLSPFESRWKVFIIHEADRMLPYSANALLKTFEEPALDAIIILISSSPKALLPTVLSRCRTIYFRPLAEEDIAKFVVKTCNINLEEAVSIAAMAQGSIGKAIRLAREGGSSLRPLMLNTLVKGHVLNYKELAEIAASIAEQIENTKKEMETDLRSTLFQGSEKDLSAQQKQSLEKEVEGALTMYAIQEANALFEIALGWYRDMHLLSVSGNQEYLIHRDYTQSCIEALERGQIIAIETVQKIVGEVRLALERSTSLHICFENFFLKLNLLR